MGFAIPGALWLGGALWPQVREALHDHSLLSGACFNSGKIRRFVEAFERGEHRDYLAIWRIWMLAVWKHCFSVGL